MSLRDHERSVLPRAISATQLAAPNVLTAAMVVIYIAGYAGLSYPTLAPLRYVMYVLPVVMLVGAISDGRLRISLVASSLGLGLTAFSTINYLSVPSLSSLYFRDFGVVLCIVLAFIPRLRVSPVAIDLLLYLCLIVFALKLVWMGGASFSLNLLRSASLDGHYDSNEGLSGALFTTYYATRKAYFKCSLAALLVILGGKRIALAASILGCCVFFSGAFLSYLHQSRGRRSFLLFLSSGIAIISIFLIFIAEWLIEILGWSVEMEEFFAGRFYLTNEVFKEVQSRGLLAQIFGNGPGSADELTNTVTNSLITLTHNDWLKIFFDYGIAGLAGFLVCHSLLYSETRRAMSIGSVIFVLMMTDNVLIYAFVQVLVALMLAADRPPSSPLKRELAQSI